MVTPFELSQLEMFLQLARTRIMQINSKWKISLCSSISMASKRAASFIGSKMKEFIGYFVLSSRGTLSKVVVQET